MIWIDFEGVYRSTASNILTATYGWPRITEEHIPLVQRIHAHTARLSSACIPGASMVDIFPVMNYFPLWMSKWKTDALEWHERETNMFVGFYNDVREKMVRPLFVQFTLQELDRVTFLRYKELQSTHSLAPWSKLKRTINCLSKRLHGWPALCCRSL